MILPFCKWLKKCFIKILQNSQEKTCARASSFNKVAGLKTFKNTFFYWTPLMAAYENLDVRCFVTYDSDTK